MEPACQLTVTSTSQVPFFDSLVRTSSLCCLYSGSMYKALPPKKNAAGDGCLEAVHGCIANPDAPGAGRFLEQRSCPISGRSFGGDSGRRGMKPRNSAPAVLPAL